MTNEDKFESFWADAETNAIHGTAREHSIHCSPQSPVQRQHPALHVLEHRRASAFFYDRSSAGHVHGGSHGAQARGFPSHISDRVCSLVEKLAGIAVGENLK